MKKFKHKTKLIIRDNDHKILHNEEYAIESVMNAIIKKYEQKDERVIISIMESD